MPRLAVRVRVRDRWTPLERALALTLLSWVNEMRVQAGLPPRTEDDLEAALRQVLRQRRTSTTAQETS